MIVFRNYLNWQMEIRGVMARLWQGKKYTVDKDWNLRTGPVMITGMSNPLMGLRVRLQGTRNREDDTADRLSCSDH